MSDYRAPVKDMGFVMDELAGFPAISQLPGYEEATPDLVDGILDEAAKFTGEVLAPLSRQPWILNFPSCRVRNNACSVTSKKLAGEQRSVRHRTLSLVSARR